MASSSENRCASARVQFSIAILAGGQSRRMGENKALLDFGGRPLISHVIETLRPLSDDLFIVGGSASTYGHLGLPHVADQYPVSASIVGIYSALAAARHERCLAVSCDMPFAPAALAPAMAWRARGYDVAVPVTGNGPEPLFALYAKSCLDVLGNQIENSRLTIKEALDQLHVLEVDPREMCQLDPEIAFMNLNTPEQLEAARSTVWQKKPVPAANEATQEEVRPRPPAAPPLVCFVGKKNSGKTTFVEKLVGLLSSRGLRVSFIKHDVHGFRMDHEGTDTWRIKQAGACEVTISSPRELATIRRTGREPDLHDLYAGVAAGSDIVIAEGYKSSAADKIEVSRSARSGQLACPEEDLIAVISDRPDAAQRVPVFDLDDVEGVAEMLMERYAIDSSTHNSTQSSTHNSIQSSTRLSL